MDIHARWYSEPAAAYHDWQYRHAVGANRRLFSDRSMLQHCSMFDRFYRYLVEHRATITTFTQTDLMAFLDTISEQSSAPSATTRHRYVKLIDRLCRYLVDIGIRKTNPAESWATWQVWPTTDPDLLYLDEEEDALLQARVLESADVVDGNTRQLRDRAITALLLGSGITASEARQSLANAVDLHPVRPHVHIPKRGARWERKVTIADFALPAIDRWKSHLGPATQDALLFPSPDNKPLSDWTLISIVKAQLEAIGFEGPEMGPRVLRNTYARRQLLEGRTDEDVSALLGLVSLRTVHRIRQTMPEMAEAKVSGG
ncbi:tyrosine-type recombinase/integrase [Pararobbsia alpina]|uniref:Tyrosine recombinase XerC n=1 Tax=Pararobbsia alpina TaxID=621374 RepID=A0A6S7BML1_9BURK|nr:tyrosine-type recombinase/integrase [Pararobbsia alpina]CAB3805415.1 Tyrosine recombinase XerC [Pararobbsia alpina]